MTETMKSRAVRRARDGGAVLVAFVAGGIILHVLVMTIDYLTYQHLVFAEDELHLFQELWSPSMLPMMAAYGGLTAAVYWLWCQHKRRGARSREQERQLIEQRARVETAQRLTGLVMERVASENAVISAWIHDSRRRGRNVPPQLLDATQNLSKALQALSRLSFELPYRDAHDPTGVIDDIGDAYHSLTGRHVR